MVMMIAITPSLNASRRPFVTRADDTALTYVAGGLKPAAYGRQDQRRGQGRTNAADTAVAPSRSP